jgi:hypothetical protein
MVHGFGNDNHQAPLLCGRLATKRRRPEAFLYERSIDIETYDRHAEKLREELTLARIDRHSGQLDELDVEGILAFAERVLPRAADLWTQSSLEQRQRFNSCSFLKELPSTATP